MATLKNERGGMTFLTVVSGKFAQKVSEGTDGSFKRTNKNGKVVYEKYFTNVEGTITNMELRSNEYNGKTYESMEITLDNEVKIQFSGNVDNAQNKSIINILLSDDCDITKPVEFIAVKDEEGYSKVFIMQHGKGIKWYSTKDDPKDVPQPKKTTKLGKTVWNWDKQNEWYFNKFQELVEKIKQTSTTKDYIEEDEPEEEQLNEDVDPDDIPF